jgi:hypothetical protein
LMEYLRVDGLCPLILSTNGSGVLMWCADASFAEPPNMHSHTSGGLTMGRGFPIISSTKQKLNTRNSTESELVCVDNMMPIIIIPDGSGIWCNPESFVTRQQELHVIGEEQ